MSTDTDNAPKMSYDSSRAVISTARALRLTMPRLDNKAVFFAGDTVIGCEFARNEEHALILLNSLQKKHPKVTLGFLFMAARPTSKELRGSTGRAKPYSPPKDKTAKGGKVDDAKKKAA